MMRKEYVALLVAIIVIASFVHTSITITREQEKFFQEVKEFMKKGGRNTADMGYNLCKLQNEIRVTHNMPRIDCRSIYFPDNGEVNEP